MTLQRMIETRQPVQAEDLKQSEAYPRRQGADRQHGRHRRARTFLAVPLFAEAICVGTS
jgi:hypothetical protein